MRGDAEKSLHAQLQSLREESLKSVTNVRESMEKELSNLNEREIH